MTGAPAVPRGRNRRHPIDSLVHSGEPTPLRIDLRDAHAVRRELALVYRDMRANQLPTQDGTRMAYVLDLIRKAYETAILQDRLEALERVLSHR